MKLCRRSISTNMVRSEERKLFDDVRRAEKKRCDLLLIVRYIQVITVCASNFHMNAEIFKGRRHDQDETAIIAGVLGSVSGLALGLSAFAGGDKVAFPDNWDKGVLTAWSIATTSSNTANSGRRPPRSTPREGQADPAARCSRSCNTRRSSTPPAIRPRTTRAVHQGRSHRLYCDGKRAGWGTEYAADIRDGEWEYQAFTPTRRSTTRPISRRASSATSRMRGRTS